MTTTNHTLKDYIFPNNTQPHYSIGNPSIEVNNFELKLSLLSMVQQNQLSNSLTNDTNLHLSIYIDFYDTLKINRVTSEANQLRFIPFSLRDRARLWTIFLPSDSITTWDQLKIVFLALYFPPSKTVQYRNQITNFTVKDTESLYKSWKKFKEMLRLCP